MSENGILPGGSASKFGDALERATKAPAGSGARQETWETMSTPLGSPITCRGCLYQITRHLIGLCRDCFVAAREEQLAAAAPEPKCNFCGRGPKEMREGEGMVQGTGAVICGACACAVAGCSSARSPAEARRMMASAQLQAEAVKQCQCMMQRAGKQGELAENAVGADERAERAKEALTLSQAAEALAHIAKGDQ